MDFIYGMFPFLPEDNPVLFWGIVIIFVLIVLAVIRALFKLAFILLVTGLIAVYVFGFSPDTVMETGKNVLSESNQYVQKTVIPALNEGIKGTEVKTDAAGQKTIVGKGFTITIPKEGTPSIHLDATQKTLTKNELEKSLSKDEFSRLMDSIESAVK